MLINDYDKLCREFTQKVIDSELLMTIDKLSRFTGERISEEHNSLENLGTIRKTEYNPKINIINLPNGGFDVKIDDDVKERSFVYYDLTLLQDSSVCSDFDSFVLVSERNKYQGLREEPRKLWIYCVTPYGRGKKHLPSINTVKKNIRSGKYTQYQSLLYEFCGVYSLSRPTDNCDKMATLYTLIADIESLTIEHPELLGIKVETRIENTHEAREAEHKKIMAEYQKNKAKLLQE